MRNLIVYGLHPSLAWLPRVNGPMGPEDCLVDPDEFTWVEDALRVDWIAASGLPDDALAGEATGVAWALEAWLPDGDCYDCGDYDSLDPDLPGVFGMDPGPAAITRVRLRYHRGALDNLVTLERVYGLAEGIRRVYEYRWELSGMVPLCDGTWEEDGGTCFGAAWWARRATGEDGEEREYIPLDSRTCRCRGSGSGRAVLLVPLLVAARRRRR